MIEWNIGICTIAEPRHISDSPWWFASGDRRAAIYWRPEGLSKTCSLVANGNCFVAIKYDDLYIVACYISP